MKQTGAPVIPGISDITDGYFVPQGRKIPPAVIEASGAPVIDSAVYRRGILWPAEFQDPRELGRVERLRGRWLYAGEYWPHFGHFLFESLSRLWAFPHVAENLDGILFARPASVPSGGFPEDGFHRRLLRLVEADVPVKLLDRPVQVERMFVPRQGCALGPLAAGTPEFRSFIRHHFQKAVTPRADKRVYISRSGYRLRRGGVFAEHRIENMLKASGYTMFSPETVSVTDQIATYLGAEQIVALDSSALHVVGFTARADQDIAMVLRRVTGGDDLVPQLAGFTGRAPLVLDHIAGFYVRGDTKNPTWAYFADLDIAALGRDLHQGGLIDNGDAWQNLTDPQRERAVAAYEKRLKTTLSYDPRETGEPEEDKRQVA